MTNEQASLDEVLYFAALAFFWGPPLLMAWIVKRYMDAFESDCR